MKNIIILFILCLSAVLFGQQKIQLSNVDIVVDEIIKTKKSKFEHRNNLSNDAESFFNQYFFPDGLDHYESLYLKGEFYGLTTNEYSNWRKTMRNTKINAEYIVYISCNGRNYAALPYQVDFGHYIHRHVKLAKQIDEQWYALSKEEAIGLADVKKLFIVFNPNYFTKHVNNEIDVADEFGLNKTELLKISDLMDIRRNKFLNPQYLSSRNQLPFQSTFEWTDSGKRKFQNQVKPEITKWLTAKNFTTQQQNQIVHLLYRGEQIEAVVKVDEFENDEQITVNDYIKELKDIFSKF